jgi:hypothetical protein
MKKILFISTVILSAQVMQAQNSEKFTTAMKASIAAMDTSFKNPSNLLAVANRFERIADAEKNQWLPYYYAALCQVNYGFMQKDPSGIDGIADRAELLIKKADSISPNNSEISLLKAMIATERMIVNPMQRYMEYSPLIEKSLETAKAQDSTNPRADYLKAENVKNTPEQFGGGCAAAAAHLKSAREKFGTFKPASEIHPNWGLQRTEMLLDECK